MQTNGWGLNYSQLWSLDEDFGFYPESNGPFQKRSDVAQSCPTLCDPMDCGLPGSSVHGIFQAIVLEWIAISFFSRSSRPRDRTQVSRTVDRCLPSEPPGKWTTCQRQSKEGAMTRFVKFLFSCNRVICCNYFGFSVKNEMKWVKIRNLEDQKGDCCRIDEIKSLRGVGNKQKDLIYILEVETARLTGVVR